MILYFKNDYEPQIEFCVLGKNGKFLICRYDHRNCFVSEHNRNQYRFLVMTNLVNRDYTPEYFLVPAKNVSPVEKEIAEKALNELDFC